MVIQIYYSHSVGRARGLSFKVLVLMMFWMNTLGIAQDRKKPHHFFNAHLLDVGEQQLSLVGNYKYGVSEEWELGTQGLFTLLGLGNVSIKHQMFVLDELIVAFSSHTFARGGDVISAVEFVGTMALDTDQDIHFGMLDIFYLLGDIKAGEHSTIHLFSPIFGYDLFLGDKWVLGLVMAHPLIGLLDIQNDLVDVEGVLSTRFDSDMGLFATLTYRWDTAHIEFGFIGKKGGKITGEGNAVSPYFNMFWRFM